MAMQHEYSDTWHKDISFAKGHDRGRSRVRSGGRVRAGKSAAMTALLETAFTTDSSRNLLYDIEQCLKI